MYSVRAGGHLLQLGGELDALRLAAGQRGGGLAEPDVVEPDVVQRLQPALDLRDVLEELDRLLDRHVEHVRDRLALEAHLERLAVVALAVALLARHVDVRQEVHLDLDLAVAAAHLAAPALDVEAEPPRLVAARPRLLGAREQVADLVEHARVGGRVGARRAADRRLVDVDDLVDLVEPGDPLVRARPHLGPVQLVGHRLVEHLVDERGLARPRHARDAAEHAERNLGVDLAAGCAGSRPRSRCSRSGRRRFFGTSIARVPARNCPVADSSTAITSSGVPCAITWPPCSPAPGPRSTRWSAARIVPSSCSTTITVLPRSRSRSSVAISRSLSRWCSPIEGSSRM